MKSYLYVLGTNPYDNSHGDYHTRGNGEWFASAPNLEEALKVIFGSMPFPGEPTGRKFFMEGVSLTGVAGDEVIQVWSSEPEIIQRTQKLVKEYGRAGLHNGRNVHFGLHVEIKVTDIEKYLVPARALLADPTAPDPTNTCTDISPMGASLIKFHDMKHEVQTAMQREQMELARKEWALENLSREMQNKVSNLNQQLGVLNTYLHGTRQRTQMCAGKKGTGKYHVFQTRQFLSEEIALLGNFADFDFAKMEDLEKWLIKSGRIWKFLPFERCILATRIRAEKKDYGDPLVNLINNYENMRNIIWIRDGENVMHVDVEFEFHNAVFPDKNQFDRAFQVCRNHLWKKAFKWSVPKNWHGEKLKPGDYDVMGKMRRKPLDEREPYYTQTTVKNRFHSLDDWLTSEFYTDLLDRQLRDAVMDYLRGVNKRQMIFAVLLQGIVDNTQLLDIPKGTDLFSWTAIDQYFVLLFDYTHALPWKGVREKIAPYLDGKVQKGDWIVACLNEYIEPPPDKRAWGYPKGTTYKESNPLLLQIVGHQEAEIRKYDDGEWKTVKVMCPVVNYHPMSNRRKRNEDWGERSRTVSPVKLLLKSSKFMRVPMPPSMAEQILDDRDWKSDNKWAVPFMVNYKKIIKAVKAAKNCTVLDFDAINED